MTVCLINFSRHSIIVDRAHCTGLIILTQNNSQHCDTNVKCEITTDFNKCNRAVQAFTSVVKVTNTSNVYSTVSANNLTVNTDTFPNVNHHSLFNKCNRPVLSSTGKLKVTNTLYMFNSNVQKQNKISSYKLQLKIQLVTTG